MSRRLIDAHIHLYAASHLSDLFWTADLPSDHVLNQQSSVNEYVDAVGNTSIVEGFIFVETDRKSSLDEAGWRRPLEEIEFLARIVKGTPRGGEGHEATQKGLALGIVPWAPVPAGPTALASYLSKVESVCDDRYVFELVKGFRYLLQDKPPGTMTGPEFVAGLRWIGDQGYTFDLCIDFKSRGQWQLQEALEMLTQTYRDGTKLKVIIDHFAKPDMCTKAIDDSDAQDGFITWVRYIRSFAAFQNTYMKLSGLFSQLPPQDGAGPDSVAALVEQSMPWIRAVFSAFGASRIMFGSDWPVCQVEGNGQGAWQRWHKVVTVALDRLGLTDEERDQVWSGTARRAYSVDGPRSRYSL